MLPRLHATRGTSSLVSPEYLWKLPCIFERVIRTLNGIFSISWRQENHKGPWWRGHFLHPSRKCKLLPTIIAPLSPAVLTHSASICKSYKEEFWGARAGYYKGQSLQGNEASWSHQEMLFLGTEDDQHLVSATSGTYISLPADTLLQWQHTELVILYSCTWGHTGLSLAEYGHIFTLDSQLVHCHKPTLPVVTRKFSRTENEYSRGEKLVKRVFSSRCWW